MVVAAAAVSSLAPVVPSKHDIRIETDLSQVRDAHWMGFHTTVVSAYMHGANRICIFDICGSRMNLAIATSNATTCSQ